MTQTATQVVEQEQEVVEQAQESNVVWTLLQDSILITSIAYVRDKVIKHNQGKFANLSRYSLEGFVEYLMECGINAVDNAVDADIKRRNEAAYVDAMSKLTAPADTASELEMVAYFRQISALKRKYGIGGDKQTV
jgi:hypothetical protein